MAPRQDATAARGGQAAAGAGGRLDLPRAARGLRPKLRPQEPRTPPRPSSRARRARRGAPAGVARVQLVRRDGRDVSTLYGGEGGGGRRGAPPCSQSQAPRRSSLRAAPPTPARPRARRVTRRAAPRAGGPVSHTPRLLFFRERRNRNTPHDCFFSPGFTKRSRTRGVPSRASLGRGT